MARLKVDRNPQPIVSTSLRYKNTLKTAVKLAKTQRPEYRTPVVGEYMTLMNEDGTPNDLVGAILTELGATIPQRMNSSSVGKLHRAGVIECDDDTKEFLSVIQDAQDDGLTWSESVILAECVMLDKDLPW